MAWQERTVCVCVSINRYINRLEKHKKKLKSGELREAYKDVQCTVSSTF